MAGYQTLLVDGDFAGQLLSNRYSHGSNDPGLRDLIDTGDPNGTVHRTAKPRLWMMPSGVSREVTAETLSADDVSLFLEMALKHYDVVVIDAGSATKNLESVLFTGACDRAVLSVDRNENQADDRGSDGPPAPRGCARPRARLRRRGVRGRPSRGHDLREIDRRLHVPRGPLAERTQRAELRQQGRRAER